MCGDRAEMVYICLCLDWGEFRELHNFYLSFSVFANNVKKDGAVFQWCITARANFFDIDIPKMYTYAIMTYSHALIHHG